MVKIINTLGDVKIGKQGLAVYQRHYGQQIRRLVSPKSIPATKLQQRQRDRFDQALLWRKGLSTNARHYLQGFAIAHQIVDSYGVPLTWDKFAIQIALTQPLVTILD